MGEIGKRVENLCGGNLRKAATWKTRKIREKYFNGCRNSCELKMSWHI
jgi:hypothetical protein